MRSPHHAARRATWKSGLFTAILLLAAGVLFPGTTPDANAIPTPPVVQFAQASYGIAEGGELNVTVLKTGTGATSAHIQRTGGTAVYGVDYTNIGGNDFGLPLGVNTGATSSFQIQAMGQGGAQPDRTIVFSFGTPFADADYTTTAPATVTITITDTGPVITNVSPSSGPVGQAVTITGSGFLGTLCSGVKFGGTSVGSCDINLAGTAITTFAPSGPGGQVAVTVTNNGGITSSGFHTFTYAASSGVVISNISPNVGSIFGNTDVTISGAGLMGSHVAVVFSGGGTNAPCNNVVPNGTFLTCTTTSHAAGATQVTATVDFSKVSVPAFAGANNFTYLTAVGPNITSVSPAAGPLIGGYTAVLSGTGLTGTSTVTFGGVPAAIIGTPSDTAVTVTVPARAIPGPVSVVAITATDTATLTDGFYYTNGPIVTAVSPPVGNGGTLVTITGTGFVPGNTTVTFGGVAAVVEFISSTQITATAPAHAIGVVPVTVRADGIDSPPSLAAQFTYQLGVNGPSVSSVTPNQGTAGGGTFLSIQGAGFQNVNTVTFTPVNGGTAFPVACTSSGNGNFPYNCTTNGTLNHISLVQPALANGQYHITVTSTAGTSLPTTADLFIVGNVPVVTSVDPNSGPSAGNAATFLTILGRNFCAAANDTDDCPAGSTVGLVVKIGSVVVPADHVVLENRTEIQVLGLPPGPVGVARVTVTTALGGTSPAAGNDGDKFTYLSGCQAVVINGINPNKGPIAGGNTATISGCGFTGVTSVKFGSAVATITGTPTDTAITVTVPAGASAGTVEVSVTSPVGTNVFTGTANDYTYEGAATQYRVALPFLAHDQ